MWLLSNWYITLCHFYQNCLVTFSLRDKIFSSHYTTSFAECFESEDKDLLQLVKPSLCILFSSVKFSFWVFLFLKAHIFNLLTFFVSSILYVLCPQTSSTHTPHAWWPWVMTTNCWCLPEHNINAWSSHNSPAKQLSPITCMQETKKQPISNLHGKKQSTNAKWTCHDEHHMMHRSSYFSCSTLMVLSVTEMQTKMLKNANTEWNQEPPN